MPKPLLKVDVENTGEGVECIEDDHSPVYRTTVVPEPRRTTIRRILLVFVGAVSISLLSWVVVRGVAPVNNTTVNTTTEDTRDSILLPEDLSHIGCRPKRVMVPVKELLNYEVPVEDGDFDPRWVGAARCLKECNSCPRPSECCLPVPGTLMKKTVKVAHRGRGDIPHDHQLTVVEHTSCRCQLQE